MTEIHVRNALNAISDVVLNRPPPLREFDQIYMKTGDLFVYAELLCRRFDGKDLIVVGDGDAIGLAIAHLKGSGIVDYGPQRVVVLDFDERMVLSVEKFASQHQYGNIKAALYNVIDPLPKEYVDSFDAFHINPPWGQYNNGESVKVFLDRGLIAIKNGGLGAIAIGHSPTSPWTWKVLREVQAHVVKANAHVCEMIPEFHLYHLDDAPDLRSCGLFIKRDGPHGLRNGRIPQERWANFYGRDNPVRYRYVRVEGDYGFNTEARANYRLEEIAK